VARFIVTATSHVVHNIEVTADTADEAIKVAEDIDGSQWVSTEGDWELQRNVEKITTKKVLYSPGYGLGLSHTSVSPEDPLLVRLYEEHASATKVMLEIPALRSFETIFPLDHVEVAHGEYYKVYEYDGDEWVDVVNNLEEAGYTKCEDK